MTSGSPQCAQDGLPPQPQVQQPHWLALLPASACYWAVLDAAALDQADIALLRQLVAWRSPLLDAALARWLPLELESVHPAYVLVTPPGGAPLVIACAVERQALEALDRQGALAAHPAELPAALVERLGAAAPLPADFNLLQAEFEPPPLRSTRRITRTLAIAGVALCLGLVALGLLRRAAHFDAQAHAATEAAGLIAARAAGEPDPVRARTRLAGQLRTLRSVSTFPLDQDATFDAPAALAALLARWPADASQGGLYIRTQSISVAAGSISITAAIPADADVEPLLAALRTIPGWSLLPTQRSPGATSPVGPTARLTLRLVPAAKSPAVTPTSAAKEATP